MNKENSPGIKHDQGKPRFSLMPPLAELEVVKVLSFGAGKYSRIGINYDLGSADKVFELCHAGIVEKVIRLKLKAQENVSRATVNEEVQAWECVSYALTEDPFMLRAQENAGLAMQNGLSRKTLTIEYDSLKIEEDGELKIPSDLLPMPKRGEKTLLQDSGIRLLNGISGCGSSDAIKEIMIVFLSRDVSYAAEKTEHRTLTTAMKQGNSVDSFAVVATTDWECWETTYKALKELSLISKPLKPETISGADNWRKIEPVRYVDAAGRHINAHRSGEPMDAESGLHHLAHAICCLMFQLEKELEGAKLTAERRKDAIATLSSLKPVPKPETFTVIRQESKDEPTASQYPVTMPPGVFTLPDLPRIGQDYYYRSNTGEVSVRRWQSTPQEWKRLAAGQVFKTFDACKTAGVKGSYIFHEDDPTSFPVSYPESGNEFWYVGIPLTSAEWQAFSFRVEGEDSLSLAQAIHRKGLAASCKERAEAKAFWRNLSMQRHGTPFGPLHPDAEQCNESFPGSDEGEEHV